MKVVFIGNSGFCISKQRSEIVKTFIENGHEVIVFSPIDKYVDKLKSLGCKHVETKMQPKGTNPFKDLKVLKNYKKLLKQIKPDMVFTFTIKPNIYELKIFNYNRRLFSVVRCYESYTQIS